MHHVQPRSQDPRNEVARQSLINRCGLGVVIRDDEESRSGQFRPITCKNATSDPRVLNPCSQGVSHAFNFDQSQVKSHEGITCVRVCEFFDKVNRVFFDIIRACFRQDPLFFCKLE